MEVKLLVILSFILWLYMLSVFKRTQNSSLLFIAGSIGSIIFGIIFLLNKLSYYVSLVIITLAGVIGDITGCYQTYFTTGTIYVNSLVNDVMLQIDIECSGLIEIIIFISLVAFFKLYSFPQKVAVCITGSMFICFSNALRIMIISFMVYFFGYNSYYLAHNYIGRIVFYVLSTVLYFYTFTIPHIKNIKIGNFKFSNENY